MPSLSICLRSTRRSLLATRDASVASLDLSAVQGRRSFNRIVEGAGRGPSCGPSPSRRVLRIWGHWAHLMTTLHRGRSSDGGFVAQFLPVRKFVSRLGAGSVPALFSGLLYIFRDRAFGRTKVLLIGSSRLHSRLPSTPNKKHLLTRQPRSRT